VSFKDILNSMELSFSYPCPDCKKETRGEVYPEDYEGQDIELKALIEEVAEKLCPYCQLKYDSGGLKNKDFI